MSDTSSNGSNVSISMVIVIVWVLGGIVFVLLPCLINRYQRELWWKRLRNCSWSVDVEPEPEAAWLTRARARYEEQQQRLGTRKLTPEQEDEFRQLFLLECMADYTTTLKECDIRVKDEVEASAIDEMRNLARSQRTAMFAKGVVSPDGDGCGVHEEQDSTQNISQQWIARNLGSDIEEGTRTEPVAELQVEGIEGFNQPTVDDLAVVDEPFEKEYDTLVSVPVPGKPITSNDKARFVPNGCAICLCEFVAGDRVTWSATNNDPHVFHEECMLKYLLSVGAKTASRRQSAQQENTPYRDPVEAATDFLMLCPCCRQTFVSKAIRSTDVTPQVSGEISDSTAYQQRDSPVESAI